MVVSGRQIEGQIHNLNIINPYKMWKISYIWERQK